MTQQSRPDELQEFDQAWLAGLKQRPSSTSSSDWRG